MTLWKLIGHFVHQCEWVRERHQGRLWMVCSHCRRSVPYNLQSCAPAPVEPPRASLKPKKAKRVKPAAVLPMRRVK